MREAWKRLGALALVSTVCLSGELIAGPLEDGRAANERGHHAKALRILEPLADAGNCDAQDEIGVMHISGWSVSKDSALATAMFRACAEKGNARGQYLLGDMFIETHGKQAIYWFSKSAQQGLPIAQETLGAAYELGWDVPRDYVQAAYWYRRAAMQGNCFAAESLGMMYEDGRGVKQDPAAAYAWLSLAHRIDPSQVSFAVARRRVAGKLNPTQIATSEALANEIVTKNSPFPRE
jgi:TPR repeat protein